MSKFLQILLIQDVDHLGNSGDIVKVKPGYFRNYLSSQLKAVLATKSALKMREKLQKERLERAEADKELALKQAQICNNLLLSIAVKVDPEGHMYGSVTHNDIITLLGRRGVEVSKPNILLQQPIKTLGDHVINLKFKAGVTAAFTLHIASE